jgi:hypothetical protein
MVSVFASLSQTCHPEVSLRGATAREAKLKELLRRPLSYENKASDIDADGLQEPPCETLANKVGGAASKAVPGNED